MTVFETTAPSQSRLLDALADKAIFATLPLVFLWFGAMKFTAYEAGAIEGLVANSPFLALLYNVFSVQAVSNLIGTVELTIAALLALRFVAPRLAAIGAVGAVGTFAVTISFFLSTPGVFISGTRHTGDFSSAGSVFAERHRSSCRLALGAAGRAARLND